MIVDKLIRKIIEMQNPTCVGLDTALEYLPEDMTREIRSAKDAARAVAEFNRGIVDAVSDLVPAVKIQAAYYEELGWEGARVFRESIGYAQKKGLIVIADAKRNDIGATASRYARAFLSGGKIGTRRARAFESDFLTVNGYLGTDGILPFADACKENDKGIFVLVKTSNPSSGEIQDLSLSDGRTVYESMADMVSLWGQGTEGKFGYTRVGAVVGATYPEQAKALRERLPHTFFLIPGYGVQGGNAPMLANCFRRGGMGGIVNNSRGVLCAYRKRGGSYAEAARRAVLDMKADLASVLGEIHA